MKEFLAFMKKYVPDASPEDANTTYGYAVAQLMVHVLKQAGDNLTRENIMKVVSNIKNHQIPMAIPGVLANTAPDDFALFQMMQLIKFDGKTWMPYGEPTAVK